METAAAHRTCVRQVAPLTRLSGGSCLHVCATRTTTRQETAAAQLGGLSRGLGFIHRTEANSVLATSTPRIIVKVLKSVVAHRINASWVAGTAKPVCSGHARPAVPVRLKTLRYAYWCAHNYEHCYKQMPRGAVATCIEQHGAGSVTDLSPSPAQSCATTVTCLSATHERSIRVTTMYIQFPFPCNVLCSVAPMASQ